MMLSDFKLRSSLDSTVLSFFLGGLGVVVVIVAAAHKTYQSPPPHEWVNDNKPRAQAQPLWVLLRRPTLSASSASIISCRGLVLVEEDWRAGKQKFYNYYIHVAILLSYLSYKRGKS